MKVKHTPAPWNIKFEYSIEGIHFRIRSGDVGIIAKGNIAPLAKYGVANARLIAAAPDLLEALKGVIAVADRATVEFDRAKAAIAKAEGE